jgi:C-terminal processing protease CtpA/Prc
LRDIGRSLTRGDCSTVRIGVNRDGRTLPIATTRLPSGNAAGNTHDRPGDTFQLLSNDVAYLKLSSIAVKDVPDYIERAKGTKGLVIDIRNYPSEFVVFALGSLLVDSPTPFARFTNGDLDNPGAFRWTQPVMLTPQTPRYAGKVAVLVDEVSQSQAEYTSMAFRAARAVVVGSTTAGADGNVSQLALPGGHRTAISGIGVFYPDKKPTQRIGIVPDIEVRPTVAGIRAGRDEVLEAALRQITP